MSEQRASDYLRRLGEVTGPAPAPEPGEPSTLAAEGLPARPRYEKAGVHFTPTQRAWLRARVAELGDPALSMSDLVRLAVARLAADDDAGRVELAGELHAQAIREITAGYAGRLQRGMPRRPQPGGQ